MIQMICQLHFQSFPADKTDFHFPRADSDISFLFRAMTVKSKHHFAKIHQQILPDTSELLKFQRFCSFFIFELRENPPKKKTV